MTRRTLIVNPDASRVTEQRDRRGRGPAAAGETLRTEHRGHATELAARGRGDEVWVLGGDGVVNEALNGIRAASRSASFRPVAPNVLARALGPGSAGSPSAASTAAGSRSRQASASTPRSCGSWRRQQRAQSGRRSSNLQYGRAVAGRLLRGSEPRLEVVGQGRAAAVFVSNDAVYTYAGPVPLRIPPRRAVRAGPRLRRARSRDAALFGQLVHARVGGPRDGRMHQASLSGHDLDRIEVRCDVPLPLQADGEDLGDVREAVFEAERDAVPYSSETEPTSDRRPPGRGTG